MHLGSRLPNRPLFVMGVVSSLPTGVFVFDNLLFPVFVNDRVCMSYRVDLLLC